MKELRTFRGEILRCVCSSFEKLSRGRTEKGGHLKQMDFRAVSAFDRVDRTKKRPVLK